MQRPCALHEYEALNAW